MALGNLMRRDVDPGDVQALAVSGFSGMKEATYLLLRVTDTKAARRYLAAHPPTAVSDLTRDGAPSHLTKALQVAFTASGLTALGLAPAPLETFSPEFLEGMAGSPNRSLRLGDTGANAPTHWSWGYGASEPHVLLMIFAPTGALAAYLAEIRSEAQGAFAEVALLPTSDMDGREPFGFVDGVSQPTYDWAATRRPGGKADREFTNLLALGELLLGYRDEYDYVTASPYLAATTPGSDTLEPAASPADARDLGRNGSYLVFRQLDQDVLGFWRWLKGEAARVGVPPQALAETMVGRRRDGAPLDDLERGRTIPGVSPGQSPRNGFLYDVDPDGLTCPLGAHIRRANPRTGDYPAGLAGPLDTVFAALGLTMRHETRPVASTLPWPRNTTIWPKLRSRDDAVSSARFHRILRRGREYGGYLRPEEAMAECARDPKAGLNFICLNTNISRQFEFVQSGWLANSRFAGLSGEQDPLTGNREPFPQFPIVPEDVRTDGFSRPGAPPNLRRSCGLPRFVRVRGGGYFFLPGLAAYAWLTRA